MTDDKTISAPTLLIVRFAGKAPTARILSLNSSLPDAKIRSALAPNVPWDVPSKPVNVPTAPPLPPTIVPIEPPSGLMFPRIRPLLTIVATLPEIASPLPDIVPRLSISVSRPLFWIAATPPPITPLLVTAPIVPVLRSDRLALLIVPALTIRPMLPAFANAARFVLVIRPALERVAIAPRLVMPNWLPPKVPVLVRVPILPPEATYSPVAAAVIVALLLSVASVPPT